MFCVIGAALCVANWRSRLVNDVRLEMITKPLATIAAVGVAASSAASVSLVVLSVLALLFALRVMLRCCLVSTNSLSG